MKIYSIPADLKTIIFDIDGTLYTNQLYVFEQVDAQIRHFAHTTGISENDARKKIQSYRSTWSREHDGKKISLGNAFKAFGISIEESIRWRNELLSPEIYLKKDERLIASLLELKKSYKLICLTNNPVTAARKTLKAIGVDTIITDIVGLDTCMKSKPAIETLEKVREITGTPYENCISIGDRYDIDLALPLKLGCGAILVNGAEDIYDLDKILINCRI